MLNQLFGSNGVPATDLSQGLVAHYPLNNNVDDIAGTYDGTSVGTDFQGDSANNSTKADYVKLDGLGAWFANRGTFTISFFAKPTDLWQGTYHYFHVGYSSHAFPYYQVEILFNSAGAQFRCTNYTSQQSTVSGGFDKDTYYHIVAVFDNGATKLYVDKVAGNVATATNTTIGATHPDAIFGHLINLVSATNACTTYPSNLRIYSDAKDEDFISALFDEGYYPKDILPLPPTDGLVAHYPLTGTGEDNTGNYDSTEEGGITYIDDAEFGSVANFDGVDDYYHAGAGLTAFKTQQVTMSAWVKVDSIASKTLISNHVRALASGSPDNSGCGLFILSTGKFYGQYMYQNTETTVDSNGNSRTSYSSICWSSFTATVGKWYHLVFIVDDNNAKLYIDGVLDCTVSSVQSMQYSTLDDNYSIGATKYDTAFYNPLDGRERDVRHYDRVFTDQEVKDLYDYEKNFRSIDIDDGLVAYYPLANNSLDNYYNEHDSVDTAMTYDGVSGVFNGTTSKIETPVSDTLFDNDYTMCTWLKIDVAPPVFNFWFGTYRQLNVDLEFVQCYVDSTMKLWVSHRQSALTTIYATSGYQLVVGEYNHITIRKTDTSLDLYVNGQFVESITSTTGVYSGQGDIKLGYRVNGDYYTDGNLAHNRFYSKAISPQKIEAIYNIEKGDFGL